MKNEIGYTICQTQGGQILTGPQSEGTPYNVSIPLVCPAASWPVATFHTHPNDSSIPSLTDIKGIHGAGLENLCIEGGDGETTCYQITKVSYRENG